MYIICFFPPIIRYIRCIEAHILRNPLHRRLEILGRILDAASSRFESSRMILKRGRGVNTGVYKFSARGIRVMRALQILSESYIFSPLPSCKSHLSFLLPSATSRATPFVSRTITLFVRRKRDGRPAIRHRAAQCTLGFSFGAASAPAPSTRSWNTIPLPALSPSLSFGKVNTIPLVPYVLFSPFLWGTISRTVPITKSLNYKIAMLFVVTRFRRSRRRLLKRKWI